MQNMKIKGIRFYFRGFSWFFNREWYGTRNHQFEEGDWSYCIDIGAITIAFGYFKKEK